MAHVVVVVDPEVGSVDDRESAITDAGAEIAEHRAVIEQVKGILMMVYRIDADAAFDLLKWRSQEANIKLRVLAKQRFSVAQLRRHPALQAYV